MRKKLLITMLVVFLVGVLGLALAGCGNQNELVTKYKVVEDHAVLSKFKGTSEMKNFVVEDKFEGKPVTKIDKFALANAEYLETIHIGKNISEIDIWAFSSSLALQEFTISDENEHFAVKEGVLYTKDMKTLIAYPNKNKHVESEKKIDPKDSKKTWTEYYFTTMPDSVTAIRDNAFYKCNALYKISLSPNLETIGDRAFLKCYNVKSMPFPDTLKRIGTDGCSYMSELTDCFIPKSIEYIGNYALFGINNDKIKAIRFENPSLDGIEFGGKKWRPVNSSGFKKIPLAFSQTREA